VDGLLCGRDSNPGPRDHEYAGDGFLAVVEEPGSTGLQSRIPYRIRGNCTLPMDGMAHLGATMYDPGRVTMGRIRLRANLRLYLTVRKPILLS
jgi:hypothetical protein